MKLKAVHIGAGIMGLIAGVFFSLWVIGFIASGSATKLLPVSPVIVSTRNNSDHSELLDYCATIIAEVRNDGGNGDVVIEVKYSEGAQAWTKSTRQKFTANETKTISIDFPEATLGGEGIYEISAR